MKDKYLTYNALDFAQDEAFLRWIKAEDARSAQGWESWLAQHPEKREEVEAARRLVEAIVIPEAPVSEERIGQLWDKIDAATSAGTTATASRAPRRNAYRWIGYATAAALALLLAFFFLLPDGATVIEAPYGQVAEYVLPDGSTVRLNAGTSIRYQAGGWAETRSLELDGEAFFEVEKGAPFVVRTTKGTVEVLGTSFNVNTFEGRFDVHCYTGRVQVKAGGEEEVLTAGQLAQWQSGRLERSTFDSPGSPEWPDGRFEYHRAPLSEVFAEMERQFNIRIDAPDSILARTYTGAYERNGLDSALYRVCWPMQLEAQREGQAVVIRPAER